MLRPDAGRAIALLTAAEILRHTTYNVSAGRPSTHRDLVAALEAITPVDQRPERTDGDPAEQPYLDISRLTDDTGFTPRFDAVSAVADYFAWRSKNPR